MIDARSAWALVPSVEWPFPSCWVLRDIRSKEGNGRARHPVTIGRAAANHPGPRGHGALYDALSAGRAGDEQLFSLPAAELPQAVGGPQARAWIAERAHVGIARLGTSEVGVRANQ